MDPRQAADKPEAEDAQYTPVDDLPVEKDFHERVLNPDLLSDEEDDGPVNETASQLDSVLDDLVSEPSGELPEDLSGSLSEDEALWAKINGRIDGESGQDEPEQASLPPTEVDRTLGAPPSFEEVPPQPEVPDMAAEPEKPQEEPRGDDEQPELHMASRRALLAASNFLPIDLRDPKEGVNEINLPLSAFGDLETGQTGFISISVRPAPGFKEMAREWLKMRKAGSDPDTKKTFFQSVTGLVRYMYAYLTVAMAEPRKGGEKPTPPWRRGKDLQPLPAGQIDDDEKASWKDAKAKVMSKSHFEVIMRAGVVGPEEYAQIGDGILDEVCLNVDAFNTPHQAIIWESGNDLDALLGNMGSAPQNDIGMILSDKEVAVLAHPMDDTVKPHNVKASISNFKQLALDSPIPVEDPYEPQKGVIPIGLMNANSEDEMVIGMNNAELDKHLITVGKTGSGKSEWLKWVVHGISKADYPLVLIDPHGQLSEEIFYSLIINSPERHDDLVFFDLADERYPVAMNPLDVSSLAAVDGAVGSVKQMLSSPSVGLAKGNAPRAIGYAEEAMIALCHANLVLEDPLTKCTLLDVLTFFQDPEFRRVIVDCCQNTAIQQRYDPDTGPFEVMGEKKQVEETAAVTRSFNDLGRSAAFQAVFSSPENKLDFARLIGSNKIVLIKLSRFGSGQAELGAFVGSLVLPWLLSSMSQWGRTKDPRTGEVSGRGCRVMVDEAPTLMGAGSSVPQVLAEARKWDLGLVLAAQFLDQFDASIIDAALVNTNSKISMVQDPNKASPIAKAIAGASPKVKPEDIASLPNYHFYGNILLPSDNGVSNTGPFSAACLPMIDHTLDDNHYAVADQVIERSRKLVSNNLEDVHELNRKRISNIMAALKTRVIEDRNQDLGESVIQDGDQFDGWSTE